ncbi:247_t:CDS:2 [Paraglomus brasilianum]|uniref:Ubiquitin carboxyl-terminal hydrolase n=1 Tax=Paraglomus brasilianum TaxID=144538 RepID=A0A9N9F7Y0_9GLOM|nr:247_t:CDS:2 [Paraglomus brasilianum]
MTEQTKRKSKWLPLESNPDVLNEYAHKLGLSPSWAYTDVFGLDSELLAMVPQPVVSVLLLYPITANNEAYRKEQAQKEEQIIPSDLIFYKQTISNACGTIGLLHSLANSLDTIQVDGPLKSLIEKTKDASPEERARVLEEDNALAEAHQSAGEAGQTRAPRPDEDVKLHFICFSQKNGRLYQLDGRNSSPIDQGPVTNLLEDSAKIIKKYMELDPTETQFSVIALSGRQD